LNSTKDSKKELTIPFPARIFGESDLFIEKIQGPVVQQASFDLAHGFFPGVRQSATGYYIAVPVNNFVFVWRSIT
jgi:hypothetical protein